MNPKMSNILCQFKNHQKRKIINICFNKDCKSNRMCCLQCNGEFHREHPESLIEIDSFYSFIQEEWNKQADQPMSYTFGQFQLIQGLQELLVIIDGFYKLIKEQIDNLKKSSLQEYLKTQTNAQQVIEGWNKQVQFMLQYFEVENFVLTKKNEKQGKLNEFEEKSIQRINQVKASLEQFIQQFNMHPSNIKFKSIPEKFKGHQEYVKGVAISSDGAMMASGSDDKTVKLWDVQKKQLIQTFQYNGAVYGGVALSKNNQYLAYGGGGDHSIQLYDLKKNTNYAKLMGHKQIIAAIVFSQDSQLLYSGGGNKLLVWNISQKTQINKFCTDSSIWTIVNSANNKLISCMCWNSINIWDYSTKTRLIHQVDPHNQNGYGLCSSKDSSKFISSGSYGLIIIWKLVDSQNNQKSLKLTREIKAADKAIFKVILTPDERYIVSLCNVKTKIMIHEIESGNLIQELQYEDGKVTYHNGYIAISNDMNILVSGGQDNMVKIWTRE